MSTVSTVSNQTHRGMSPLRVGLALSAFLGLVSIPVSFMPVSTPDGDSPPLAIVILSIVLGLVSIVCAVIAWPSGNRIAIRINAAAILLNCLSGLPALFVDVQAWVKVGTAIAILLSVAALVLTLRRQREPFTVTD